MLQRPLLQVRQNSCNTASGWALLHIWAGMHSSPGFMFLQPPAALCPAAGHGVMPLPGCRLLWAMAASCAAAGHDQSTQAAQSCFACCWVSQQLFTGALGRIVGCDTCMSPAAGEGKFAEASDAYEAAGEVEAVVRLNLDKLRNPHKAAALARRSRSVGAAALVAQYCVVAGDFQVSAAAGMLSLGCSPACPCGLAVWAEGGEQLGMAPWQITSK